MLKHLEARLNRTSSKQVRTQLGSSTSLVSSDECNTCHQQRGACEGFARDFFALLLRRERLLYLVSLKTFEFFFPGKRLQLELLFNN